MVWRNVIFYDICHPLYYNNELNVIYTMQNSLFLTVNHLNCIINNTVYIYSVILVNRLLFGIDTLLYGRVCH